MTTLAKIIRVGVANHGASNDRVLSVEHELIIIVSKGGLAIFAGNDISEITVMPNFVTRASVGHALGIPVRSSSLATLNQVTLEIKRKC